MRQDILRFTRYIQSIGLQLNFKDGMILVIIISLLMTLIFALKHVKTEIENDKPVILLYIIRFVHYITLISIGFYIFIFSDNTLGTFQKRMLFKLF